MHLADHIFMLILVIVQPIYGALSNRNYIRKIKAGEEANPVKLFRETLIILWVALAVLATAWYALERPAAELGLVAPGGIEFYVGIVVLVLICGFMAYTWHRAKNMTEEQKAKHAEELGDVAHFLPRNQREYRSFFSLSITAGIVEEIIYRGFVIWYLAHVMPLWSAVVVSSVIFGLGHGYQGITGIFRAALLGLGFGLFYTFTGSIWLSIIGHMVWDILTGKTVIEIFRDS